MLPNIAPSRLTDSWDTWKNAEELKRTIFAFYAFSVSYAAFLNTQTPFLSHHLNLEVPTSHTFWTARSASEWNFRILSSKPVVNQTHPPSFSSALHALATRDTTTNPSYELATPLGQRILLCAILELLLTARNFPTSFPTISDHQNRNMSHFLPREDFSSILKIWQNLWWRSPETAWDSSAPAHPEIETLLLWQYCQILLNGSGDSCTPVSSLAAEVAVEVFCSVSKNGFSDVAYVAPRTLSPVARRCALACARVMEKWSEGLVAMKGPRDKIDDILLARTRAALRRSVRERDVGSGDQSFTQIEDVKRGIVECWSMLIGDRERWTDA
jgi:hypothetical protein